VAGRLDVRPRCRTKCTFNSLMPEKIESAVTAQRFVSMGVRQVHRLSTFIDTRIHRLIRILDVVKRHLISLRVVMSYHRGCKGGKQGERDKTLHVD
jgi:hypothetical protein